MLIRKPGWKLGMVTHAVILALGKKRQKKMEEKGKRKRKRSKKRIFSHQKS